MTSIAIVIIIIIIIIIVIVIVVVVVVGSWSGRVIGAVTSYGAIVCAATSGTRC